MSKMALNAFCDKTLHFKWKFPFLFSQPFTIVIVSNSLQNIFKIPLRLGYRKIWLVTPFSNIFAKSLNKRDIYVVMMPKAIKGFSNCSNNVHEPNHKVVWHLVSSLCITVILWQMVEWPFSKASKDFHELWLNNTSRHHFVSLYHSGKWQMIDCWMEVFGILFGLFD